MRLQLAVDHVDEPSAVSRQDAVEGTVFVGLKVAPDGTTSTAEVEAGASQRLVSEERSTPDGDQFELEPTRGFFGGLDRNVRLRDIVKSCGSAM